MIEGEERGAATPVRFVLVGASGVAAASLAPAIARARGAKLVGIVSRDVERANDLARRVSPHAPPIASPSLVNALDHQAVDAVLVATPDALHVEHARAALDRGKHVLVEKPLATTVADAEALVALARAQRLRLGVGYHLRHHAGHRAMRALLRSGELGPVRHLRVQWAWASRGAPPLRRWWALAAAGTHAIDLAMFLLDEAPARAHAVLQAATNVPELDETAAVTLEFPAGAIAEALVSTGFVAERRVEIHAERGSITAVGTLGPRGAGELIVERTRSHGAPPTREPLAFTPVDPYQAEVEDFVEAIRLVRDPEVSGEAGLAHVKLLDQLAPLPCLER